MKAMEIELAVLAFAGKKFAQGAIAWLGLQTAKRLFERDPEQQCSELYLEVCADAFRHFPDGTNEEADRVRDFLARKRWLRPPAESWTRARSTGRE